MAVAAESVRVRSIDFQRLEGESPEQDELSQLDITRLLTEIDHLNRFRKADGSHSAFAVNEVRSNLVPAVKEAAMPYAVSTTYQEYRQGDFMWLDQTPEQVARSGYRFHEHPAALERVDVEVDEARSLSDLKPGVIQVFISPRMSTKDAPRAAAQREHLADDDMIRIHMVDMGPDGQPLGKFMQSVLVRHIPLSAWVAMLRDPHSIFGKAVEINDEGSALSVMKVHRELNVPEAALPKGALSIIEAVIPYADPASQAKIREELALFSADQDELHRRAATIAERWLHFEQELADSVSRGIATESIRNFIRGLAFEWDDKMAREIMDSTQADGSIAMTRSLAAKLEASKRNTLWVAGGVVTGNQRILRQLAPMVAQQIYVNELFIQAALHEGESVQHIERLEINNDKTVARQNVTAGAGCPGEGNGFFGSSPAGKSEAGHNSHDEKCPEVKDGQSVTCPSCHKRVHAIVPSREKIYCSNPKCKLAAPRLAVRATAETEAPKERGDGELQPQPERAENVAGNGARGREAQVAKQQPKQIGSMALAGAAA